MLPLEMEMQDARGPGSSTPALLLPGQSERADGKGAPARWWGPRASNEHIQVRVKMKMHCQQLGQVSTMLPLGLCCPAYNCKCHQSVVVHVLASAGVEILPVSSGLAAI